MLDRLLTVLRTWKNYLLLLLALRVLRTLTILCLKHGDVRTIRHVAASLRKLGNKTEVQELLDLAAVMDTHAEEIVLKRSGLWRRHG